MAEDTRVTQVGRVDLRDEDRAIRVTQVGRVDLRDGDTPDIRNTQTGRVDLRDTDTPKVRLTQAGVVVIAEPPFPTPPVLITPDTGVIVESTTMRVAWQASTDPLEGAIWYTANYRKVGDTVWTNLFTGQLGNADHYEDISSKVDGSYEIEIWAYTVGYSSQKDIATFTIHKGRPTAPEITAPYEGQQWKKVTNNVTWEDSYDPDDDPLTYDARYKKVSDGSWTSLFTGETDNQYEWDHSGFDADDYELELWSNDGVGDSVHSHVYFTIFIADEPAIPRIRIVEIGATYIIAELDEYVHPTPRDWQATKWEIMPWGGSWNNPSVSYTTTDSTEQFLVTINDLAPGFRGSIRASFQDDNNSWGDPSAEALFQIPFASTDWERRYERQANWSVEGLGIRGRNHDWPGTYVGQPVTAIVDPEAETMGSFIVEGFFMGGGCYCGWAGRDTELRKTGIGIFTGDSERGGMAGVWAGISFGIVSTNGGHSNSNLYTHVDFDDLCPEDTYFANQWATYGPNFEAFTQVTAGIQPYYGQPIGPWRTKWTHYPVYHVKLWVQRNLSTGTTRIRSRVQYSYAYSYSAAAVGPPDPVPVAEDEWTTDQTLVCLTPCGKPGYWFEQPGWHPSTTYSDFFGLTWTALRDEGQLYVENVEPMTPYSPPGSGPCSQVTEDALADPVFFPAPPNGDVSEDWIDPVDVIRARNDDEQRISLRENPVERIEFTTTLPTAREVGHIKALIWEEQPSRWGVPMWMDAARLDVQLSSGASSIPAASVDTVGRRFDEATHVAIWKDQFTWDFLPATFEADGSITLTGTTSRTYEANQTYVIPCRIGRMRQTAQFDRTSPTIGDLTVTFILEAVDG